MKTTLTFRIVLLLFAFGGFGAGLHAQVSGLSYNLQPTVNYNFFDEQSGLDDGLLYGGRIGLGFGENVELRAMYMRSAGLTNSFTDFGLSNDLSNLAERDVDLTRYGGEVKLNLSRGRLLPYLTLGAGIQEFQLDGGSDSENIYAAAGLGITLKIFDRFTLNVEGRNTSYNQNSIRSLLTEQDRIDLDNLDFTSFEADRLSNWSIGAGLNFYLGGRRPGTLSEVDRAYAQTFGNGFANVSLLVEPTLTRINWDDALPYVDTYLGGASLGVDFGPLVGARVFYYRSMEDGEINFDFDDLSMYGADFRFRFSSVTSGLSPFLTIGGGYIDVQDDYLNRNGEFGAESQAFATGGGGISLNITPNFRLTGTYRALLTSGSDVENIEDTDQIRTSSQWSAGINLAFGKRAKRPDAVFASTANARLQQQAEDQLRMQAALADQARKNAEATNQLKADYEVRMDKLKVDLEQARINQDSTRVAELEEELEETEDVVEELEERTEDLNMTVKQAQSDSINLRNQANAATLAASRPSTAPAAAQGNNFTGSQGRISLTPAELEGLIEEIFEGINDGMQMLPPPPPMNMNGQPMMMSNGQFMPAGMGSDTARINQMERELKDLRNAVSEMTDLQKEQRQEAKDARDADKASLRKEMNQSTESILKEIREMRSDISNKSNMTDKERRRMEKKAADEAEDAAKAAERAAADAAKEAEAAAKAAEKAAKKAKENNDN